MGKENVQSSRAGKEINYNLLGIGDLKFIYHKKYEKLTKMKEMLYEIDERLLESMSKDTKSEMSKRLSVVQEKFQSCLDDFEKIIDAVQNARKNMQDGDSDLGRQIQKKQL